jgi:TolB-like protein
MSRGRSALYDTSRWPSGQDDLRINSARVPVEVCRAQVEKIVSGVTFGRADQLRRLLLWLSERSLEPVPIAPSEKEIGELVLNRKDFDPQTDSLVRKEMSRLREKLAKYYLLEGSRDGLRIRSTGGYLLRFEWAAEREAEKRKEIPCWLVLPFRAGEEMSEYGLRFFEELLILLSENEELTLISPTTALAYAGRAGDIRQFAAECGADFVVEGSLRKRSDKVTATVWLIDGANGRSSRSSRISGLDAEGLAGLIASWLLDRKPDSGG